MIAAIEKAILARAKAAGEADVLNYKFGTAENYPQDWDEHLVSSAVNFPAIYCNFASFTEKEQTSAGVLVNAYFGIVVAAKNLRNSTTARQGFDPSNPDAKAEPGSLQLMNDVVALFQRETLDLEISPIEVIGGQAPELSDGVIKKKVSLMAVQVRTTFVMQLGTPFDGRALGDFATFHSDWDVPPFGTEEAPSIDLISQTTLPIQEP